AGSAYQAVSAEDTQISTALLKVQLRPLSADEVKVELEAWLALLHTKAREMSLVELALADPELKEQAAANSKKAVELNEEKSVLIEKVRQVIISAETKGVDIKSADLYVRSVGGISTSGGFTTVILAIKNWVVSPQGGIKFVLSIGAFLMCVFVASLIGRVGAKAAGKTLDRAGRTSDLLRSFFVNIIRRIALVIGIVIGLSYLGVNVGPMIAAIGGVGFVIGFALKDSLGNFAAGLMILFYRPFDIGNFIKTAGVSGTVESLSLVSTVLKTSDNQEVIIPNGKVWSDVITNVTAKTTRRVDLVFGVGYDDDLQKVQSILEGILEKHELVLKSPEVVVKVHELADSSVNLIARPWVKTSDYWDVYWDVTRQVKEAFDDAGISIPFPQQDVHMTQK
ncbi:MAG: mechanosensitive ion channel family protein, partial [Verrucomicrobia bacterium]|nr:mechanosensitive ion channel family protein [Verrucomicrobiota bacterium]